MEYSFSASLSARSDFKGGKINKTKNTLFHIRSGNEP